MAWPSPLITQEFSLDQRLASSHVRELPSREERSERNREERRGRMSSVKELLNTLKPYLAMIFLQFGYAGMYIISVASLKQGMNHYVLVVYRNAVAAAVIAPFALWFERSISLLLSLFHSPHFLLAHRVIAYIAF